MAKASSYAAVKTLWRPEQATANVSSVVRAMLLSGSRGGRGCPAQTPAGRGGAGPRLPAADAGGAEPPGLGLLRAVLLAQEARPDPPARAVLGHLFEEVR